MENYAFYLEYDGKRTVSLEGQTGTMIQDQSIDHAVEQFAKANHLVTETMDQLSEQHYRIFYAENAWLKPKRQVIYQIKIV